MHIVQHVCTCLHAISAQDKLSLQHVKARLLVLDEQHSALQLEHETLLQRFGQVEHERDAMHGTFEEVWISGEVWCLETVTVIHNYFTGLVVACVAQVILTVQQRNSKRHEVLQRRLGDVQDKIERKVLKICFRAVLVC